MARGKHITKADRPAPLRVPRAPLASRENSLPGKIWASQWVAALRILYPGLVNQEAIDALWPATVSQWRYGASPEAAARNVCVQGGQLDAVAGALKPLPARFEYERTKREILTMPPQGLPSLASLCKGPECDFGLAGATCGLPAQLVLPSANLGLTRIKARYCLTDVRNLLTSHDPLRGFAENPDYPPGVQERDYSQAQERIKVERIADDLDPGLIVNPGAGALDNLAVSNEQGVVLGGNGRTMAVRLYYSSGSDERGLKEYIADHAREYGFSRAEVDRIAQPIIVRTIRTRPDPKELAALVRLLNVQLGNRLGARELAVSQARTLDPGALALLAANLDAETPLSVYLGSAKSADFVAQLRKSQIVSDRNVAEYITDRGVLNADGRRLVERLLLAALIPDVRTQDALGEGTLESLTRAAPFFLAAGAADSRFDLAPAIDAAARDLISIRRMDQPSVDGYLAEGALFASEAAAVTKTELGEPVLRVLFSLALSPAKLARVGRRYASYAQRDGGAQVSLIASEVVTPRQAIVLAARSEGVDLP